MKGRLYCSPPVHAPVLLVWGIEKLSYSAVVSQQLSLVVVARMSGWSGIVFHLLYHLGSVSLIASSACSLHRVAASSGFFLGHQKKLSRSTGYCGAIG